MCHTIKTSIIKNIEIMKTVDTLIKELENHRRKTNPDWKFDFKKSHHFVILKISIDRELNKLNQIEKIINK